MIIAWNGQLQREPKHILQEAGYHEFIDPNTGKTSYIFRLGREYYPRMHVYINRYTDTGGEFDIHLDQKQASYEGQTAHAGEYDGPVVQEEAERLQRWIIHYVVN